MAAITYVCSIAHVASLLGEDPEMFEAIASNDDNLTYGNVVSVHTGPDEYITALTNDGIEEIREMLAAARLSAETWRSFLEDFVDDPEIIERVMNLRLRSQSGAYKAGGQIG